MKKSALRPLALGVFAAATFAAGSAVAMPMTYVQQANFDADLAALATPLVQHIEDFESHTAGTAIPDGSTLGGLTYTYTGTLLDGNLDFGLELEVSTGSPTTSGVNYLGTTDGGVLLDGDTFDITFPTAVHAVSMFFLTADTLFDDDISISGGGAIASLNVGESSSVGNPPDDSAVYFLGIINPDTAFTSISISNIGGGFFFYNVDDIAWYTAAPTGVPTPGVLALLGVGLIAAGLRRRSS